MTSSLSFRNIVHVALQQVALAAVVALLAIAWLHVPDANAFEVLASVVLALLIVAVACGGEAALALRITNRPRTARRLLLGALAIFVAALLWYAVSAGLDHIAGNDEARWAGYLNSSAPASVRNVLSYEHFTLWFRWLKSLLEWSLAGLLVAAAFTATVCDAPFRGLGVILRSGFCWVALVSSAVVCGWLTWAILGWTPGHGLRVEAVSLLLRLVTVAVLHAGAVALLLTSMARAVVEETSTVQ